MKRRHWRHGIAFITLAYRSDGLQQTELDCNETVEIYVWEPEAFHVEVHLSGTAKVRHFLGQVITAQHQRVVLDKCTIEQVLCGRDK